jgi:hypothetical protein
METKTLDITYRLHMNDGAACSTGWVPFRKFSDLPGQLFFNHIIEESANGQPAGSRHHSRKSGKGAGFVMTTIFHKSSSTQRG